MRDEGIRSISKVFVWFQERRKGIQLVRSGRVPAVTGICTFLQDGNAELRGRSQRMREEDGRCQGGAKRMVRR